MLAFISNTKRLDNLFLCFADLIIFSRQECIPVGCVPAARRPYAVVCFRGGEWWCAWSGGWWCAWLGGVSGPGGSASVPCGIPPPPVNRMTNRCKNITLAITSLRLVKMRKPFTRNLRNQVSDDFSFPPPLKLDN